VSPVTTVNASTSPNAPPTVVSSTSTIVYVWGSNESSQLGLGASEEPQVP